ncbi:MAG: DUF4430 domain-containing protein [Ruminococcaceae bacterium]|nr:DUF4430 domain-containing protein [Oscillospiraceae bacterium]
MSDLEKKIRIKRIRSIIISALLIIAIVFGISTLKFEQKGPETKSPKGSIANTVDKKTEEEDLTDSQSNAHNDSNTEVATNISTSKKDGTKKSTGQKNEINTKPNPGSSAEPGTKKVVEKIFVTIEIRCDEISKDTSVLENQSEEMLKHIPKDGTILKKTTVTCDKGTSVYQVLFDVCMANKIQLDSERSGMSGRYVKGINYLYEKACGTQYPYCGWMYQVNGVAPNYGCSSYRLQGNETILWYYVLTF